MGDSTHTRLSPSWDDPEKLLWSRHTVGFLYLNEVTVSFDGFRALNELSLTIDAGELRCIIGGLTEQGKTTMMDVITGKTRPDSGTVFYGDNIDLLKHSEAEIASFGIGRKFQKPTVFINQTVAENLELAGAKNKRVWPMLIKHRDSEELDRIDDTLRTIGLSEQANRLAGVLSHGQKQWLEIGMLLMQDPQLLLG